MSQPAEKILEAIRALPAHERVTLVERVLHEVAELVKDSEHPEAAATAPLGLFSDETELVDEICEAAMVARERDPLRRPDA